jgi:hypothetical protein
MRHNIYKGITVFAILCLLVLSMLAARQRVYSRAPDGGTNSEQTGGGVDAHANLNEEAVLFRKPIEGGRELLVVRSPRHAVSEVRPPVMPVRFSKIANEAAGVFTVSLQVVHGYDPPLTLASRLVPSPAGATPSDGIEVFGVLVYDGLIVVALWNDREIELWSLMPYGDRRNSDVDKGYPGTSALRPAFLKRWQRFALVSKLERRTVTVALILTEDGRVQADVENAGLHSRYVQDGDKWEFKKVSVEGAGKTKKRQKN